MKANEIQENRQEKPEKMFDDTDTDSSTSDTSSKNVNAKIEPVLLKRTRRTAYFAATPKQVDVPVGQPNVSHTNNKKQKSNYKQITVMDKEPGQRLKHANAELKDFNFQLQLTHLQYIDVKTLEKKDKKKFKQKFGNRKGILTKKNYWIGHRTESSNVISEDYF